jgi:hypothetical protein
MEALLGMAVTKSLSAMAALGVPDALRDRPLYYTELVETVGADQVGHLDATPRTTPTPNVNVNVPGS